MSDEVVGALSGYALAPMEVGEDVLDEVAWRLLDTVGVALGSLHEPATRATRRYLYGQLEGGDARVWGTGHTTSLQLAALVNGAAARCLDFNDAYFGLDGSHPSDVIPGLVAAGEATGATGIELAEAIAVAYEVVVGLSDSISTRANGFDHVTTTSIGACCGLGRLLNLTEAQLQNALSLTIIPHVAMRQTRCNRLTMWKGIAAGNGVRNAVNACEMAVAGIEGPSRPFTGDGGLLRIVAPDGIRWESMTPIVEGLAPCRILDTHVKLWPVGYLAQAAVDAAVDLHSQLEDLTGIETITIGTFEAALDVMGRPEMWVPETSETADHSIVYATISALFDGEVSTETFDIDRVQSPRIREVLRNRVKLVVLDEFTDRYPSAQPARVEVTTTRGGKFVAQADYPRGHANNRATRDELRSKFDRLVIPVLGEDTTEAIAASATGLVGWKIVGDFTKLLVL